MGLVLNSMHLAAADWLVGWLVGRSVGQLVYRCGLVGLGGVLDLTLEVRFEGSGVRCAGVGVGCVGV